MWCRYFESLVPSSDIFFNATFTIPSLQYRSGQLFVSGNIDYVSIFNVNGSKVMQTDEKVINNIPAGIYIVQLVTNNASKTYKFRVDD